MNGMRFQQPSSNESMSNILNSPRLGPQQPMLYNGMQQAVTRPTVTEKTSEGISDYLLSDLDLDHKPVFHSAIDDSLHIDPHEFYDFRLFSGSFDLENEETRLMVEKLLG